MLIPVFKTAHKHPHIGLGIDLIHIGIEPGLGHSLPLPTPIPEHPNRIPPPVHQRRCLHPIILRSAAVVVPIPQFIGTHTQILCYFWTGNQGKLVLAGGRLVLLFVELGCELGQVGLVGGREGVEGGFRGGGLLVGLRGGNESGD